MRYVPRARRGDTHIIHTNLTQNEIHIRRQRHHERPDEHAVPGPGPPPQRAGGELPERGHTLSAPAASASASAAAPTAAAVGLELCSRTFVAGARRAQDRLRIVFVDLQMLCDEQHSRLADPRNGFCIPTPPALNNRTSVFLGALEGRRDPRRAQVRRS